VCSSDLKILTFHGDAITGITASNTEQQMLTVARYNGAEFWVYDVKVESGKDVPTLEKHLIVSNSPLASWRGEAVSAQLWNDHQPRAQVAQIEDDRNVLYYLANGQRSIGRVQFEDGKARVLTAVGPIIGERCEYFLKLVGSHRHVIATIENYQDCFLRTYSWDDDGSRFLQEERQLGGSLFYGLAQDNEDELMMLVPKKGNYPLESNKESGVYRVSLGKNWSMGEPQKDPHFDAITLPEDLRGLAPVFSEGKLHGYLMSTYRATRDSLNGGEPSELFYTRVLKE
jgi:hypothetical protein